MDETLSELNELKDFFSAPSDAADDPYSLGVAGLSSASKSRENSAPKSAEIDPLATFSNRRFRVSDKIQKGSLFDEEEDSRCVEEGDERVAGVAWAEMAQENRRLKQQLQFLTNELSAK